MAKKKAAQPHRASRSNIAPSDQSRPAKPLNRHRYSDEMGLWGERRIREYFSLDPSYSLSRLAARAHFVTMTFDPEDMQPLKAASGHLSRRVGAGKAESVCYNASYELDQATHFVNLLRYRLRGIGRKRGARDPLIIVAVDFDGSRSLTAPPEQLVNLHLHMLVIFDETDAERGAKLLASLSFLYRFKFATLVDDLDVRTFDFNRFTIRETVSYITKGDALVQGRHVGEPLIRVYPDEYRLSRRYMPISGVARSRRRFRRAFRSPNIS